MVRLFLAAALLAAVVAAPARAQVLYGSLVGNVTDPSGSGVPAAQVLVQNANTNLSRTATTDSAGAYSIPALPAGSYTIRVTATGFQEFHATDVPITINTISRLDARLKWGTSPKPSP